MPITSCEGNSNFSKLSFIKYKLLSTITEWSVHSLCIFYLENDIVRNISYDETVSEYIAIETIRINL